MLLTLITACRVLPTPLLWQIYFKSISEENKAQRGCESSCWNKLCLSVCCQGPKCCWTKLSRVKLRQSSSKTVLMWLWPKLLSESLAREDSVTAVLWMLSAEA